MNEVQVHRPVRIHGTELAREVRATLKSAFPGVKFSVVTDKYAGGSTVRVSTDNREIFEEDVEEALNVFNAKFRHENVSAEEMYNGNGGWNKVEYPLINEDGSITPYYYDDVRVCAMRVRWIEEGRNRNADLNGGN